MPNPRNGLLSLLEYFLVNLLYGDQELADLTRRRWSLYLGSVVENHGKSAHELLAIQYQASRAA